MDKPGKFTALFFLVVVMSFMFLVAASVAVKQLNKVANPETTNKPVPVDWEEFYPFGDGKVHTPPPKNETMSEYVKRKLEEYTSEYLIARQKFVEAAKKYEELAGWNMASVYSYNPVIKLQDGFLSGIVESRDVSGNAEALRDFNEFCRKNGAELVYLNFPAKICRSQDNGISGTIDYTNQNADRFLSRLVELGVKFYDFRELLHNDGRDHHGAFFRTDHHWRPESGLWAAGHILRILRDDYGRQVSPGILDPGNFEYVIYPEWFLGSQGKKLTLSRTEPDDFMMIYPKFKVSLDCRIPNEGVDTAGNFSVIYNFKAVEEKDYYTKSPYHAYVYGDQALIEITNIQAGNKKRILLIHDSFSDVVIPFLSLGIGHTCAIDLRQFMGSVEGIIRSERPDVVIVSYNSAVPGRMGGMDWKFYDFR